MASVTPDLTSTQSNSIIGQLDADIEWEETDLNLSEIAADDNSLPCLGCFEENVSEEDGIGQRLSPGLKIYSRQPVLFHMATTKKQVRARSIYKEKGGAYYEVGQTLIIPDDYLGWFEVVPSDFSRSTCYKTIEELAKSNPRKFFTRSHIKGIRVEQGEDEAQKYLERKIQPGSVLETKGHFKAKWKTRANTGLFKKRTTEWEFQEVTYLKCVEVDGTEIMIPFSHKGKFNVIYENGKISTNAVYTMKDILSDLTLPVRVRLLYGKAPVVPCIFTGMLILRNVAMDEVIIGSTVLNTRNVLFEIPVKSVVKAKRTSNDDALKERPSYIDAQKLCGKYAALFSSMIKLSPDLDTHQKVIQHVPADSKVMQEADDSLKALDLITDISLTNEPRDQLIESSDTSSSNSEEQSMTVMPKGSVLTEMTEYKSSESQTFV